MRLTGFLAKKLPFFLLTFRVFPKVSESSFLLLEFSYPVPNTASVGGRLSHAIDRRSSAQSQCSFWETGTHFHFRTRLIWGCAVGFLHKNLRHWNEGGLADNEVAEDSANDLLWDVGQYASVW